MKRVLVFHNILSSHYKGKVFSELFKLCKVRSIHLSVIQYAVTERRRSMLGATERGFHNYPYRLAFDGLYDDMSLWAKLRIALGELRREDPDVVVLPGYWDLAHWFMLIVAGVQRRRIILSFDSTEFDRPRFWVKERMKKIFVSRCDAAFTYGQRSKRYLKKLGMLESRITVPCQAAANEEIRAEFDAAKSNRLQLIRELGLGSKNFCYVGRLSPEKNVSCLIRAFSMVSRCDGSATQWGLLIVGDGPERQQLTGLCDEEKLTRVNFVGGKSWREVPRYLVACDVLVLPSVSEAWGLVVNEAMVCGLPVLVSDACGCVDELVINGQTGFAFDPRNPSDLRESMEYFVRFPEEIQRFGLEAEKLISKFTPSAAAQQMLHGIERLLGSADPDAKANI